MDKSYFRIAEKIAARLLGCASKEEEQEIEEWGRQEGHRVDLLEKLNDPENFLDNQNLWSDFPVEEGWEKSQARLEKKRTFFYGIRSWGKYAAVLLMFISGAIWFLTRERPNPVQTTVLRQSIPSGKQGARLTLGNGKVMDVTPDNIFTLSEIDGTLIHKDKAGIDYSSVGKTEDTLVYNQMETLTGMEYTLTLADGTRVFLNAGSCLKFPVAFRGDTRVVELSGEAYFKVAKDQEHPFIVKMEKVELKVLGTSFNVRSYTDEKDIVATLVEGRVEVNGVKITPGKQARYERESGKLTVDTVDVDQYIAWQQGRFVFRNERLEDIMRTLGRWYGVDYHFLDERAKDIRLGARFGRYDNMDPILDMLRKTDLVKVIQTNRSLYLSVEK